MHSDLKRTASTLPLPIFLLGLALLSAPQGVNVSANEAPNPAAKDSTTETQPAPASKQPSDQNSNQSLQEKRDDRVYISDIYPEYCRAYFPRRDWVSLNTYRVGMYRCKYGTDRWH